MPSRLPTAPLAGAGLIAGFAVASATGSRPLGGLVLGACGLACMEVWRRRDGGRTALALGGSGLLAFALSHVLAQAIGAWPSVLVCAAATGALSWHFSDRERRPKAAQASLAGG